MPVELTHPSPAEGRPAFHGVTSRAVRGADGRRSNLSLLLQCLYDQPDLSRAELARRTGLTRPTVSDLVATLIADGLVGETGRDGGARTGKPATMLAVLDSRDIVALDLSAPDELRGGVYSLRGVRRTSAQVPLDGATGEAALHVLETLVADLRARAAHPVLGLGIATPGTIDASGTVMTARSFGWNDLPLRDIVASHAGVPVTVLNDANAAAVGEQAFAGGPADLLRVQLAVGVGAGLLLGGQLVIGQSAAVGEIGHLIVDYQGRKCICGRRGCLETWASIPALTRRLAAEPGRRDEILAEGGRRLGMALVPVLAMLDLDDVVLGGPPALFGGVFTRAAQDLINERLHSEFRADVRLRPSTLGDEATLLGVVAMVLRTTLGVW